MPLALSLLQKGHKVLGSDRAYDQGTLPEKFDNLIKKGVVMHPQDGRGVTPSIDVFVVSSAVEEKVPDVKAALDQNITIQKRAELLAELFNAQRGIAVAGTSGKTTVTAMIGHILYCIGMEPNIINGGQMLNFSDEEGSPQAFVIGKEGVFVTETDESDNSVLFFSPEIGVLNNIALDHKPIEVLQEVFIKYLNNCKQAIVINGDNEYALQASKHIHGKKRVTFGIQNEAVDLQASYIKQGRSDVIFSCIDHQNNQVHSVHLLVPGEHNISNALAAMAACLCLGVPLIESIQALGSFRGTRRRLEVIGNKDGVTVYDDFGHNPDKITATLKTLRGFDGRLLIFYQPHGFGPTKMLRKELVESFVQGMYADDELVMPEIYYAGGTVEKSISSLDIINDVKEGGHKGAFFETREECGAYLINQAKSGDRIVIMGARDDTLTLFAKDILAKL